PAIGDQWWLMRTSTLRAITKHAQFENMKLFMRKAWIPDEMFFQTMLTAFLKINLRPSLTYAEFDRLGKPYVFYDDHLDWMKKLPGYFARKIWPGADKLYSTFLADNPPSLRESKQTLRSRAHRVKFHATNMGHLYDVRARSYRLTDQPFYVFVGFRDAKKDFAKWLSKSTHLAVVGSVFARKPDQALLSMSEGNQALSPADFRRNPHAVLANLLATTGKKPMALMLDSGDHHGMWTTLLRSGTAKILFLEDQWKARLRPDDSDARRDRVQAVYGKLMNRDVLKTKRAELTVVPWADFASKPRKALVDAGVPFLPRSADRLSDYKPSEVSHD
ncbi:MAG: hypothetical protein AAF826_12260, partial [Pseudomonadota bacterium]